MFFQLKITLRNLRRGGIYSVVNIGGLTIGIALGTVSLQAVRAAVANPVEAIKSE